MLESEKINELEQRIKFLERMSEMHTESIHNLTEIVAVQTRILFRLLPQEDFDKLLEMINDHSNAA